jgi:hypothetical protein
MGDRQRLHTPVLLGWLPDERGPVWSAAAIPVDTLLGPEGADQAAEPDETFSRPAP